MKYENITKKYLGFTINPCGYKLVALAYVPPEITTGGVILTEASRDLMRRDLCTGLIIALGEDCYSDSESFPTGPYCAIGDWVHVSKFEKQDKMFRDEKGIERFCYYLNDNRIDGVIPRQDVTKSLGLRLTIDELEESLKYQG